jgi:anaerobic ribonucleoside-triphosphate reductase activating protein
MHRFLPATEVEGPGRRAAIWVQGCSIRCPGCFSPHTWRFDAGISVATADLEAAIEDTRGIEGVTFLGGEPFDQASSVAELARAVRGRGLSVMTFSGYDFEALQGNREPGWAELLRATDLLVDGPYVASLPDTRRPWVGSTNQRFRFLTDRYRHLEPTLRQIDDALEIRIGATGEVLINGMASQATLDALRAVVRSVGRASASA